MAMSDAKFVELCIPDSLRLAEHQDAALVNEAIATTLMAYRKALRDNVWEKNIAADINRAMTAYMEGTYVPHISKENEDWSKLQLEAEEARVMKASAAELAAKAEDVEETDAFKSSMAKEQELLSVYDSLRELDAEYGKLLNAKLATRKKAVIAESEAAMKVNRIAARELWVKRDAIESELGLNKLPKDEYRARIKAAEEARVEASTHKELAEAKAVEVQELSTEKSVANDYQRDGRIYADVYFPLSDGSKGNIFMTFVDTASGKGYKAQASIRDAVYESKPLTIDNPYYPTGIEAIQAAAMAVPGVRVTIPSDIESQIRQDFPSKGPTRVDAGMTVAQQMKALR